MLPAYKLTKEGAVCCCVLTDVIMTKAAELSVITSVLLLSLSHSPRNSVLCSFLQLQAASATTLASISGVVYDGRIHY